MGSGTEAESGRVTDWIRNSRVRERHRLDQEQTERGESQTGPGTSESGRATFGPGTETESGRATFRSGTESESGRARDQELESKEYDTKSRSRDCQEDRRDRQLKQSGDSGGRAQAQSRKSSWISYGDIKNIQGRQRNVRLVKIAAWRHVREKKGQ